MGYNKYPKEMKESIITRLISGDESVTDINKETGVGINHVHHLSGMKAKSYWHKAPLYEEKRLEHPERWSRKTKAWEFSEVEWLNPR